MIFDKGAETIQWGKNSLFNQWCWDNWLSICKEWRRILMLYHIQKLGQNGLKT